MAKTSKPLVLDLSEVGAGDVQLVGGKCASLGELFARWCPAACGLSMGLPRPANPIACCWKRMVCGERLRELTERSRS